jgi:lambda family phage portal protein
MNASVPGLVSHDGTPLRRASTYRATSPYRGADPVSQELGGWHPSLNTPTGDLARARDPLVARTRDLDRNNGYASGIKQTLLDSVIGTNWRLRARPNWRVLGIDYKTAVEWSSVVEAKWRSHADNPGCWIDAARRRRFSGLLRTQFTTWQMAGEHLSVAQWEPDRIGPGRARYATCIQLVDPDRLGNPNGAPEAVDLRMGVHLGRYGDPLGYWIRDAHPADWVNALEANTWTYSPRETPWGRPVTLHGLEEDREGWVRGVPPLAAVVEALRLQDVYERYEAIGAILNAFYAAVIQTQTGIDPESLGEVFGKDPTTGAALPPDVDINVRGVAVPVLPPGVELKFLNAARPAAAQFAQFEDAVLRRIAAGSGLSYEQVSRDYSKTNYSSARASFAAAWKFMTGRSAFFATTFADPVYAMWLEEAIDRGEVELPKGAPDFYEARSDWVACRWIGPGRGWIDPVKEAQASRMKIDADLSTLEDESAEQGVDWEETLEQKVYENHRRKELGLPDTGAQLYRVNSNGNEPANAGT